MVDNLLSENQENSYNFGSKNGVEAPEPIAHANHSLCGRAKPAPHYSGLIQPFCGTHNQKLRI